MILHAASVLIDIISYASSLRGAKTLIVFFLLTQHALRDAGYHIYLHPSRAKESEHLRSFLGGGGAILLMYDTHLSAC